MKLGGVGKGSELIPVAKLALGEAGPPEEAVWISSRINKFHPLWFIVQVFIARFLDSRKRIPSLWIYLRVTVIVDETNSAGRQFRVYVLQTYDNRIIKISIEIGKSNLFGKPGWQRILKPSFVNFWKRQIVYFEIISQNIFASLEIASP